MSMTDPELLAAAIDASGEKKQTFAVRILGIAGSSVRRVLSGDRQLNATERIVCTAIIADPSVALILAAAADGITAP